MPTNTVFDENLLRRMSAKASELYLRDHHPYELAFLLFGALRDYRDRFKDKYRRQVDFFAELFSLREDFQMHSNNAQFRTARMTIIRTVMEDADVDVSGKFELVRVLSDAYELIDHLTQLYSIAVRPGREHVLAGIVDAESLAAFEQTGESSSGDAFV